VGEHLAMMTLQVRACRDRFADRNFSHVKIKVRSCSQQGFSRDHSRRVDERPYLSSHAPISLGTMIDIIATLTTLLYAQDIRKKLDWEPGIAPCL
jgi:hypothetical protein